MVLRPILMYAAKASDANDAIAGAPRIYGLSEGRSG